MFLRRRSRSIFCLCPCILCFLSVVSERSEKMGCVYLCMEGLKCVCVCVSVCVRVNSFHFVHVVDGFTGDMCFFVSLFVFLVLRVIFVLFLLLDFVLWFYGCHLFYCFNVFVSVTCFN